MQKFWVIVTIAISLNLVATLQQNQSCKPFGLRLNLGMNFYNPEEKEMLGIRFNTKSQCPKSYVMFQKQFSLILKTSCTTDSFILGTYVGYVHKCSISQLAYGDTFSYMAYGWEGQGKDSPIPFESTFIKTHLLNNRNEVKLVILADWGYLRVKQGVYDPLDEAFKSMLDIGYKIDGIYIGGDIAYDLDSYEGLYYQDFIKMLSQVGSRWPVILNTGNHQHLSLDDEIILQKTFEIYGSIRTRLTVLNLPFVKWFMLDPYRIVFKQENSAQLVQQFQQKLQKLNRQSPSTPIITCSHYPYRCNGNIPDCFDVRQKLSPFFLKMMQNNVALYMGAHYHTYERVYPYYHNQTFIKKQSPYTWIEGGQQNPLDNTLLSIVEGIAGNDRQIIMTYPPDEPFTAAHVIGNTGFGIMTLTANSMTYDHVLHKNAFQSQDRWVMFFQHKDRGVQIQKKNINQGRNQNIRIQTE